MRKKDKGRQQDGPKTSERERARLELGVRGVAVRVKVGLGTVEHHT